MLATAPGLSAEARAALARWMTAGAALPAPLAELYALRAGGMSYEELSGVLAIPVGTVKSRVHEMVSRLRQEMER